MMPGVIWRLTCGCGAEMVHLHAVKTKQGKEDLYACDNEGCGSFRKLWRVNRLDTAGRIFLAEVKSDELPAEEVVDAGKGREVKE